MDPMDAAASGAASASDVAATPATGPAATGPAATGPLAALPRAVAALGALRDRLPGWLGGRREQARRQDWLDAALERYLDGLDGRDRSLDGRHGGAATHPLDRAFLSRPDVRATLAACYDGTPLDRTRLEEAYRRAHGAAPPRAAFASDLRRLASALWVGIDPHVPAPRARAEAEPEALAAEVRTAERTVSSA